MEEIMAVPNWRLIPEAIKKLGGKATIPQIKKHFEIHHPNINLNNVHPDATMITVNAPSRIHHGAGKKVRRTDTNHPQDCLFKNSDGSYELYDPKKHGVWEIYEYPKGNFAIKLTSDEPYAFNDINNDSSPGFSPETEDAEPRGRFALESHLRDYLAQNLNTIAGLPEGLCLYKDKNGITGVEYHTPVGIIDVLAVDGNGSLYVFELKLGRGSDTAVGQVLRYMGWLKANIAGSKNIYGVLMAGELSDNLRHAASIVPSIYLFEYQIQFTVKSINNVKL